MAVEKWWSTMSPQTSSRAHLPMSRVLFYVIAAVAFLYLPLAINYMWPVFSPGTPRLQDGINELLNGRAYAVGAVMSVVPDVAALDAELETLVDGLLALSPVTVRATKHQLLDRARRLEASPAGDAEILREVYTGPDFAEGVRAFAEKRPPSFPGR